MQGQCGNNIVEPGEECDNVYLFQNDTRICIPNTNLTSYCEWWDTGRTTVTIYSPSTAIAGYANYSSCQSILGYPTYCDKCGDGVIGPLEECEHSIANSNSSWPWNINLRAGCTNNCKRQAGFACDNNIPSTCRYCRNYTTASDEDQFFCNDWNLVNGDGCSDKCLVEQGWTCTIDTSILT